MSEPCPLRSRPLIAVLPGDGIGPEVIRAALAVLEISGFEAEYRWADVGWAQWCAHGDALPAQTLETVRTSDAALFGAITSKSAREATAELAPALRAQAPVYRSPIVRLRQELDLFACLRPSRAPAAAGSRAPVDILTVREGTEGEYAGVEHHWPSAEAAEDPRYARWRGAGWLAVTERIVSERACSRVALAAFRAASARRERRVVLAEKANILRATGGLFVEAASNVAESFPDIDLVVENVDATCMRLAMDPAAYGVILAGNLFGDIISDIACGLTGGPGLAASASLGPRHAVFEPVHGSAPDIAGKAIANPLAAIRAAAMLAAHLGDADTARRIDHAVDRVLTEQRTRTPDLGGSHTTTDMTTAVLRALDAPAPAL